MVVHTLTKKEKKYEKKDIWFSAGCAKMWRECAIVRYIVQDVLLLLC